MFTANDIKQMEAKGLTIEKVETQIELFKTGVPFANLTDAATIDHGILKLSQEKENEYISYFEDNLKDLSLTKFVPASGAATRMFKFLFQFLEDCSTGNSINLNKNMLVFYENLVHFPFYDEVIRHIPNYFPDFENGSKEQQLCYFVRTMLDEDKLNMGTLPKGLLPFHKYNNRITTAFEEHLNEAPLYAASNGKANLHFTISKEHIEKFQEELTRKKAAIENTWGITLNVTYSTQNESTDTIAVTPDNSVFRQEDGSLLFRPSGHGALLKNLNAINTDIVFIKNIDNVVVTKYSEEIAYYKKLLGGLLLSVQNKVYKYLNMLEDTILSEDVLSEIVDFLNKQLNVVIPSEFVNYTDNDKHVFLTDKLNRPIRVCGMVKNEGEPGGGPFWVKDENGTVSLQIVESAQIDLQNSAQKEIFKQATHFNPVDLVCGIKNYKGDPFNLLDFVDEKAAFISSKTQSGKPLKALELPGLWNGSMAKWNTIFVEVPLITFNPVKTVNDLLKPAHQAS